MFTSFLFDRLTWLQIWRLCQELGIILSLAIFVLFSFLLYAFTEYMFDLISIYIEIPAYVIYLSIFMLVLVNYYYLIVNFSLQLRRFELINLLVEAPMRQKQFSLYSCALFSLTIVVFIAQMLFTEQTPITLLSFFIGAIVMLMSAIILLSKHFEESPKALKLINRTVMKERHYSQSRNKKNALSIMTSWQILTGSVGEIHLGRFLLAFNLIAVLTLYLLYLNNEYNGLIPIIVVAFLNSHFLSVKFDESFDFYKHLPIGPQREKAQILWMPLVGFIVSFLLFGLVASFTSGGLDFHVQNAMLIASVFIVLVYSLLLKARQRRTSLAEKIKITFGESFAIAALFALSWTAVVVYIVVRSIILLRYEGV